MSAFTVGTRVAVDADIRSVQGEAGLGFYRLAIRTDLRVHRRVAPERCDISDLRGELRISAGTGSQRFAGNLVPRGSGGAIHCQQYEYSTQLDLDIELEPSRLEAIEELRAGGGLRFHVALAGVGHTEHGVQPLNANLIYDVHQGQWVDVLGAMSFKHMMLMEVPLPQNASNGWLTDAVGHLEKARNHLLTGDDRECVGACRDALESIETALGETNGAQHSITRASDKKERLGAVRWALKQVCHPARHADQVSATFDWNRIDAVSMVTILGTLLRWMDKIG